MRKPYSGVFFKLFFPTLPIGRMGIFRSCRRPLAELPPSEVEVGFQPTPGPLMKEKSVLASLVADTFIVTVCCYTHSLILSCHRGQLSAPYAYTPGKTFRVHASSCGVWRFFLQGPVRVEGEDQRSLESSEGGTSSVSRKRKRTDVGGEPLSKRPK